MEGSRVIKRLKLLRSKGEDAYSELQGIAKTLVGYQLLFTRGKKQKVFATVEEWCPHSLRVIVRNLDTKRRYEVDITRIVILKIVEQQEEEVEIKKK